MKYVIYLFISIFIFSVILMAQETNKEESLLESYKEKAKQYEKDKLAYLSQMNLQGERKPRERLEQLEKLNLIETLQMDEETTLRFFARKSEYENKIKNFRDTQDEIVKKIHDSINDNSKRDNSYYKKLNGEFIDLEEKISSEKSRFIQSLSDLLSSEQISKLIAFHDKWTHDVRNMLMDVRFRKHK